MTSAWRHKNASKVDTETSLAQSHIANIPILKKQLQLPRWVRLEFESVAETPSGVAVNATLPSLVGAQNELAGATRTSRGRRRGTPLNHKPYTLNPQL